MANPNEPLTNEMIAKQIGETARSTNSDSFRVRISRKDNAQQFVPKIIGTLDGATSDHLASPETWLSQFAGGGHYFLQASHKSNPTAPFAPMQVIMSGDPLPPDAYADVKPTWRGPETIIMPEKQPRAAEDGTGGITTYVGPLGAMGTSPRNGALQGSAPNGPAPAAAAPVAGNDVAFQTMRLQQMQDDLARRERAASEERHRQELELGKRASELDMAKIRAEMAAATAARPQGEDPLTKMLAVMREEAKERAVAEEARRREDRDREDRRLGQEQAREDRRIERDREDRKEREAERMRLEERLAAERKSSEDRLNKMLEDKSNASKEMMEMMSPLTDVMGQTMNLVVQSMHAMQELQPQAEGEPPMLRLVGKIVDGIQAAAAAARVPPVRIVPPPRAAPRPPPPPPPRAPPPRMAEVPRPAPAPVASPVPAAAPAPVQAAPTTPAFDGVEPKAKTPAMDRLLNMIKAEADPNKVARFFYTNVNDPSIATELAKNNMLVVPTFAPHLLPWLKGNDARQVYLRAVFEAVQKLGASMGAIEAVEPDGEEEPEPNGEEEDGPDEGGEADEDEETPEAAAGADALE